MYINVMFGMSNRNYVTNVDFMFNINLNFIKKYFNISTLSTVFKIHMLLMSFLIV